MSTVPTFKGRFLTKSGRQVLGVISMLLVGTGISGYAYYRKVWLPSYLLQQRRERELTPVRRTKLYVAGTEDGEGLLPNVKTMPTVIFFFYVGYRCLLLFVGIIPIFWFGLLTFKLKLCPEQVFYERVVKFLSYMGPTYIKLGQWMASRPDFFPPEMCEVFKTLFDNTDPHPWSHTEKLLRRTYSEGAAQDNSALRYISEIEKEPVNSGSIAQIHRAKLRVDVDGIPAGTELALKVTHPHIREQVAGDLAAMKLLLSTASRIIPGFKYLNLDVSVSEFSSLLRSQLNLLIECDNLRQFTYNFRQINGIVFPQPLPTLCTEDVLFETFEEGEPLQNIQCSDENRDVAELGCHMFLKMLFDDNFAHSDLHPGNLLLRTNSIGHEKLYYPNGKQILESELVILDAGLVTTLSRQERNNFISLFAAVATGDGELGADLMLDRIPDDMKGTNKSVNREKFRREMKEIFDMVSPEQDGFKLSNIEIGKVLGKVISTARENNASLDGNFASLVLTVMIGEGLGRKLVPEFNIFAEAAPYLIAYLEDSELFFLANKLRNTYGATGLLRDSVKLVHPNKAGAYIEMGAKKVCSVLHRFVASSEDQVPLGVGDRLHMPTAKAAKGKKKGKTPKRAKVVPDPDIGYREQLHTEYYIPKAVRDVIDDKHREAVREAIVAFSDMLPNNFSTDCTMEQQSNFILITQIPDILSSLNLSLSDDQFSHLEAMTDAEPTEGVTDTTRNAGNKVRLISRVKLERLLVELLRTHILAYDSQVLRNPDVRLPIRVSSTVQRPEEARMSKCFEAIWKFTGSQYTHNNNETSVRCVSVDAIRRVLSDSSLLADEYMFTEEEVRNFSFAFAGAEDGIIREDVFLTIMLDV